MLKKELNIFTFQHLLEHYPYRHIDKTKINLIADINYQSEYVQVAGVLTSIEMVGEKSSKRLIANLRDKSSNMELTWFQSAGWIQKMLKEGQSYIVFGKISFFQGKPQIVHPEIESFTSDAAEGKNFLEPVYPSTEKLKTRGLGGRQIGKLTETLLVLLTEKEMPELIPDSLIIKLRLMPRIQAMRQIHFPLSVKHYENALRRLKFEELFIAQLRLGLVKLQRHRYSKGVVFDKVGEMFNGFYNNYLPFELTDGQKKVIKEIRQDTASGRHMNRLLQGDVGSGKTIVSLLCMLIAIDNGYQCCMMAPTEILSQQHFDNITTLLKEMPLNVQLITGSTKSKERKQILEKLLSGEINILIGTHAVLEDPVQFKNLGFVNIDEQHRFGVAQRAKLWAKAKIPPHILVMTATPIPRTLAMTAYGDLDYSVIDELPPGRKPINTVHRFDNKRSEVMSFIREEIAKGRQAYIIFPLIEESDKLDYENLMQGYENVKAYFPEPKFWISMLHGRQKSLQKNTNMQRFVERETQIMVSTTVIEVGVNVPNASVMVIENAEKFGLSQLHQLRGRVGRGAEKSYCILMTGVKLSNEARERIKIMTSTNDGFVVSEKDLEMRGPGDIEGTRQSGELNFKLASLVQDRIILETARTLALNLLEKDPDLSAMENLRLNDYLRSVSSKTAWSKIS